MPKAADEDPEYDANEFEDDQDEFVEEFEEEEVLKEEAIAMFDEDGEPILRTREEMDEQNEEMATGRGVSVAPFLAVVKTVPTAWVGKTIDSSKPKQDLDLEWVYGYRCHDSRNNIALNSEGEIVYPAASLLIALDSESQTQRYFRGHNDDVLCLAQSPVNLDLFVSGQVATVVDGRSVAPHVCLTNTKTNEVKKIANAAERAVRAVTFLSDGNFFVTAGCDDKFTLTVWDSRTLAKVASAPSAANTALQGLTANPVRPNEFASIGSGHLAIWTFDAAKKQLSGKQCLANMPKQIYTSCAYTGTGNQLLVGGKDGGLYVLVNGSAKGVFRVQEGKVSAILPWKDRFFIGGEDGQVSLLNAHMKPLWQTRLQSGVRALHTNEAGDLLVGTRAGQIFRITAAAIAAKQGLCVGETALGKPAMEGHFDGELWGVAPHPKQAHIVATCGEDNTVYVWNTKTNMAVQKCIITSVKGRMPKIVKAASTSAFPVNQRARAIAYSPDGSHLAVGSNDGSVLILDANTLTEVAKVDLNKYGKRKIAEQSQNWIETIQYSPTGKTIAVGTHGICIVLLQVPSYTVVNVFKEHTAAILSMDFSADSKYLRSVSLSYEILYHYIEESNYKKCKHEPSAKMTKDINWATVNVKFDWSLTGIWKKIQGTRAVEYFFVQGVDVNPQRNLVATATHEGVVSLFRYPCVNEDINSVSPMQMKYFEGHSSHIPRVRFSADGKHLFSTGGEDKALFQWRVVE